MQGHPTRRQVIWAAVMHSVPEGSCASWRTEDESGQPKALAVALSFCRLLGLGCPKQAFAKIATLFLFLRPTGRLRQSTGIFGHSPDVHAGVVVLVMGRFTEHR
jgi:hypothetical protein